MRIIAGKYRSRIIKMPKAAKIRPTKDRVREALFGILGDFIPGTTVLDLYAGSGAFGIEALSRGAKRVVFVDNDKRCIETIRANVRSLAIDDKIISILHMEAQRAISFLEKSKQRFDLILLDPPYHKDMAKKSLIKLDRRDILTSSCIIVAEHYKDDILPKDLNNITSYRTACYGDVYMTFYKLKYR